jgi:transcriptional regulator with XRE-family HTH domain
MSRYEFGLVLGGLDIELAASTLDAFEQRVDDFTFASHGGVVRAAVERTAGSLGEAIRSAIADAESIPGVRAVRVEPEEHVSQSEMAARLGRSRQSVSQLVSGTRGPGGFPPPALQSGHVALWRWTEVSEWAEAAGLIAAGREARAWAIIRAVNAVLEARHAVGALDEEERASLADLVT